MSEHCKQSFWYALAQTAIETNHPHEALRLYQKVEAERAPFFRQDHAFSDALMHKVVLLQSMSPLRTFQAARFISAGRQTNILHDLRQIVQYSPEDWRKNLFVALQYAQLGQYDDAEALLIRNIDHNKEISLNLRVLGEVYALSQRDPQLCSLITDMTQNEQVRYQDAFYLFGKIRHENLLRSTLDSALKPYLNHIHARLEDDSLNPFADEALIISLPTILLQPDLANISIFLRCLNKSGVFAPEEQAEIDQEADVVRLRFRGVLDSEDLIEHRARRILVLKLSDGLGTVSVRIDVSVRDVVVDGNVLDKTGDFIKGTIDSVFSEKSDTPSVKTRPEIFFTFQEIATDTGVCYSIDEGGLEHVTRCRAWVEM